MIEWIVVMVWWTAPDAPTQRQVLYGPGTSYQMRHQADCENTAQIRQQFMLSSDWPYKSSTKFVCESNWKAK